MPRFCRFFCGPRVTTRPQVMSGPASPGQQVWIGKRPRSTSPPSHTISWQGALDSVFGAMCSTSRPIGIQRSITSRNPCGGSGSFRNASSLPTSRSASTDSAPMPSATRFAVPNRLPSTGIAWPFGRSNNTAGPPALRTRSQISVISSRGSTSTATRFSSPMRSSWATKSRRSRYFTPAVFPPPGAGARPRR